MPSDGKNHQRITVKWRCVKMNNKQVLRKGQYRLSHNIFAKKENKLSTPPVLKSDATCSQFELPPGYLIQTQLAHCCTTWSTSAFQLPFFRCLHCKWNSLTMDIPVYNFFCIIQDNGWHLAHFSNEKLSVVGVPSSAHVPSPGDNFHVSKLSQFGNPNYNLFLFWDVRQWEPFVNLCNLWVIRMSTETTPCPVTLVSTCGGSFLYPALCCCNWDYFTSMSEKSFKTREE